MPSNKAFHAPTVMQPCRGKKHTKRRVRTKHFRHGHRGAWAAKGKRQWKDQRITRLVMHAMCDTLRPLQLETVVMTWPAFMYPIPVSQGELFDRTRAP